MALLESSQKLQQFDSAINFSLKNVSGETISLDQFQGKPLLLMFMCNHCPFVIKQLDELIRLQNTYEEIVLIGINSNDSTMYPDDSYENMQVLAKNIGLKYYLYDETQSVAKEYGASCTPDPFLFNAKHELVFHGRINDALSLQSSPSVHDLDENMKKVLTGERIEHWFVPSMGCSIKWK